MNLLSLASWTGFLVALFTGIDGLKRNRRTLKGWLFFLLAFSIAYWCFGYAFLYPAENPDRAWFWYRFTAPAWSFLPAIVLHFFLVLTDTRSLLRRAVPLYYFLGGISLVRVHTGLLIVKELLVGEALGTVEVHGVGSPWYLFYLVYQLSALLLGLFVLLYWRRRTSVLRFRKQAELILAALVITLLLINSLNYLPSILGVRIPALAPTALVLVVLAGWYATTRYRMLELSPEIAAEHIMKGMLDGVILVDMDGRIQQMNQRLPEIIPVKKQQLIGRDLDLLLPESIRKESPHSIFRGAVREGFLVLESRILDVPVQLSGSAIFDRAGDLAGMVLIVHDLRTREAMKEADRAKSRFLAGMGHDLRTPLNGIIGYGGMLSGDTGLQEKQRRIAGSIVDNGNYLLNLLNDVIDTAKIDSGQLKTRRKVLDLKNLVREISIGFRIAAEEKGLSFYVRLAPGIPRFPLGDEKWIRRVLHNLLSNALKYTDTGSFTLSLSFHHASEGETVGTVGTVGTDSMDGMLVATVADTGPGIDSGLRSRVFLPYTRGSGQAEQVEGMGLGLSISKTLAEGMGGSLELLESSRGAQFRFTLPLALSRQEEGDGSLQGVQVMEAAGSGEELPPRELLISLKQAMDSGDVGSFLELLDKHADTGYGAFTSHYRTLARKFRINRIKRELEEILNASGGSGGSSDQGIDY